MQKDFSKGSILLGLTGFALPVFLSMFLQSLYGAVDIFVVGHYATSLDVSAVSTGAMVMQGITGFISGLSTGVTVILSRSIGEGRREDLGRRIGTAFLFFLALSALLTLLVALLSPSISKLMRMPSESYGPCVSYIRICSYGMVCICIYNFIGALFRGLGDSVSPLITVSIATLVNIALDILFVYPMHMGANGAALATVIAQGVSVLASLLLIRSKKLGLSFKSGLFHLQTVKEIIRIGSPLALSDILVSVSFLFIMSIANSLGVIASAGVGVSEKICAFIMLLPSSFMQSMTAFVAQNEGAGKPERSYKGLKIAILMSLAMGALLFYVSFFHGDALCRIFTGDQDVVAAGADYLKAYAIDTLLTSFLFCFSGYFTGKGKTLFVMANGLMGAFLVRVPLAYIFSRMENMTLFMLGSSVPISTVFQIVLCLIYLPILRHRESKAAVPS